MNTAGRPWAWSVPGLGALALLALLAGGCTPNPYQAIGARDGYSSAVVNSEPFLHRVIANNRPGTELRVYIEGDGKPWLTPTRKAADPTPRTPVALELFAQDPGPAIYLGRPCYFGLHDPHCSDDRWWTEWRYAPGAIASMNRALDRHAAAYSQVTLIGYSGGGTVAWLMARTRTDVGQVVTVAANLDVAAWARLHGYSPLTGSLDPAALPPLPARIRQLHVTAAQDDVVPPASVADMLAQQPPGTRQLQFDTFDHRCCWTDIWPGVLGPDVPRPKSGS